MGEIVQFAGRDYFLLLSFLFFSRAMDFLSTWVATPNLVLEANPIARRLGWKWGVLLNVGVCVLAANWAVPAIVIVTTSLLVSARNFQSAWIMRSLGEERYRSWIVERLAETSPTLYLSCALAQSVLTGVVGVALMYFETWSLVPFAIGMGILTYAVAVGVYTLLSIWRIRHRLRS